MWIGHYKKIRKLMFWALALRQSESDEGLTLETSTFESLYAGQFVLLAQLITPNYLDFSQDVISFVASRDSQISLCSSSWSIATVCSTVDQGCSIGGWGKSQEKSLQER